MRLTGSWKTLFTHLQWQSHLNPSKIKKRYHPTTGVPNESLQRGTLRTWQYLGKAERLLCIGQSARQ